MLNFQNTIRGWLFLSKKCISKEFKSESCASHLGTRASDPSTQTTYIGMYQERITENNSKWTKQAIKVKTSNKSLKSQWNQSKEIKLAGERTSKPFKRNNQLANLYLAVKLSEQTEVVKKPVSFVSQPINQPINPPTNQTASQPTNKPTAGLAA